MSLASCPSRAGFVLWVSLFGITGLPATARSQDEPEADVLPLDDDPLNGARRLFERFAGEETEEERKRIAEVDVSAAEESRVGDAALDEFLRRLKRQRIAVIRRGDDVRYVQSLVDRLRPLMKNAERYRSIRVLVALTDETDARSFPGGAIVVSRGMIDFCGNEAALVAVLGHELSHIDHGHQLHHLRRFKLARNSFGTDPVKPNWDLEGMLAIGGIMSKTFMRPFRPEEESEADRDGARWAFQLGYDPREMAALFQRLGERAGRPAGFLPEFLRSHPADQQRVLSIRRLSEELMRPRPERKLYVGGTNLRRRIPRQTKEFPE